MTEKPSTATSFEEYLQVVYERMSRYPTWRAGQAFFNVLCELRPDISEPIRGGPHDPFHQDGEIAAFLGIVYAALAAP